MATHEEARLFERYARHGEVEALGDVFDRTAPALLRVALHLVVHRAEAEDLVQSTFLTAIERARDFDPRRPLFPWLVGILTHHARNARRRAATAARGLPPRPEGGADPSEEAHVRDLQAQTRAAIDRLGEPYARVLALHLQRGLDPHEIAVELRRKAGTVRMQLLRGLEALRRVLPGGFALGAVVPADGGAGLQAMRAVVCARASAVAPLAPAPLVALWSGVLFTMHKALLAGGVLVAALSAYWLWDAATPAAGPVPAPEPGAGASTLAAAAAPEAAHRVPGRQELTSGPDREPAGLAPVWEETGALEVTVVAQRGGVALVGREVRVRPAGAGEGCLAAALTDAAGIARFAGVVAGECEVVVEAPMAGSRMLVVEPDATTRLEVAVATLAPVRVVVVDAAGAWVPGAELWLSCQPDGSSLARRIGAVDAQGQARLEHLPESGLLAARHFVHGISPMVLLRTIPEARGERSVTLTLAPATALLHVTVTGPAGVGLAGARVEVQAVQGGRTLPRRGDGGAEITFSALVATTDASGTCVLAPMAEGEVEVRVSAPGCVPLEERAWLRPGANRLAPVLLPAGACFGLVRDPTGAPVARALVTVAHAGPAARRLGRAWCDAAGRYRIEGLPCGVPLAVRAEPGQGRLREVPEHSVLLAGPKLRLDLVLPRMAEGRGRLVDAAGTPLAGWGVQAEAPECWELGGGRTTTDAEGRFRIPGEAGMQWQLRVDAPPRGAPVPDLVAPPLVAGGDEVTVRVPDALLPRSALAGRLALGGESGGPAPRLSLYREGSAYGGWAAQADAEGRFGFQDLPAGRYWLLVAWQTAAVRFGPFAVESAQRRDLGTLVLPARVRLTLRFARRDGGPIAGLTCEVREPESGVRVHLGAIDPAAPTLRIEVQPGTYEVGAWGTGFVDNVERPETVIVGEAAHSERTVFLEPGVRRTLAFPVPEPQGWGAERHAVAEVRRSDGSVVLRDWDFAVTPGRPHAFYPSLPAGVLTLHVRTGTGRRFEGTFVVEDLEARPEPIPVRVAELR
ncbi:MAG: sigma-70 family RNA polymerase sigma factor [Planctomycetes bacterium]|nr:sigma-70 family RNA polymerase sigma factor [Planctomycetota bacterium]